MLQMGILTSTTKTTDDKSSNRYSFKAGYPLAFFMSFLSNFSKKLISCYTARWIISLSVVWGPFLVKRECLILMFSALPNSVIHHINFFVSFCISNRYKNIQKIQQANCPRFYNYFGQFTWSILNEVHSWSLCLKFSWLKIQPWKHYSHCGILSSEN